MPKLKNSWEGGMNQDIAFSKFPKNTSLEIRNFRISNNEASSTGILENINGDTKKVTFSDCTILTLIESKDSIIFLLQYQEGNVYRVNKEYLKGKNSFIIDPSRDGYYHENNETHGAVYKGMDLEWDTNTVIKDLKINYENDFVEKLYFIDDTIKHLNIVNSEENDLKNLTIDDISVTTPAVTNKPVFDTFVSGELETGAYQYTYQLYNAYGVKTDFAPLSNIIYTSNKDITDIKTVGGSNPEKITGKGVKGDIYIPSGDFNRIRIVSIFYSAFEGNPIINIVQEKPVVANSNVSFVDSGNYIGTLSEEDIALIRKIIKPKTIESKDNYLFTADVVEEDYFDIDQVLGEYWDARAYRFDKTKWCKIYNDADNYYQYEGLFTGTLTLKAEPLIDDPSTGTGSGGTIEYEGDYISSSPYNIEITEGQEITVEAMDFTENDYEFVKWVDGSGTQLSTNYTLTFTVGTSNLTRKAVFKIPVTHSISVSDAKPSTDYLSENITITVSTTDINGVNGQGDYSIETDGSTWFSAYQDNNTTDSKDLIISVSENTTTSQRAGTVTLSNIHDGSVSIMITITQGYEGGDVTL